MAHEKYFLGGDWRVIRTKSVWSPIDSKQDGLRILVSRFRGRGLPTDRYDLWMPSLGPSEELLRAFQSGEVPWPEFRKRYRDELFEGGSIDEKNRIIKNHGQKFTLRLLNELASRSPVTVMCLCPEGQLHCHRHVLQEVLGRRELAAKT